MGIHKKKLETKSAMNTDTNSRKTKVANPAVSEIVPSRFSMFRSFRKELPPFVMKNGLDTESLLWGSNDTDEESTWEDDDVVINQLGKNTNPRS